MSVNLLIEDLELLRRVAERQGITLTEAMRRAIAMERFVDEADAGASKVLIQTKDKSIRQLVIR